MWCRSRARGQDGPAACGSARCASGPFLYRCPGPGATSAVGLLEGGDPVLVVDRPAAVRLPQLWLGHVHPADPVRLAKVHLFPFRCPPSLTCRSTNVGLRALRNDGVERIREKAPRTAVEATDVAEFCGFLQVAIDEPHVAPVVQTVSDLDPLRGKTTFSRFFLRRTGRWSASTCAYPPGSGVVRCRAGRVTR